MTFKTGKLSSYLNFTGSNLTGLQMNLVVNDLVLSAIG